MEMILALIVFVPIVLFCFALGAGVEQGVRKLYEDD